MKSVLNLTLVMIIIGATAVLGAPELAQPEPDVAELSETLATAPLPEPESVPSKPQERSLEEIGNLDISLWRLVISLLMLIVLLVGGLVLVKRLGIRYGLGQGGQGMLVKQRLLLDPKNALALVRVRDEDVLIGISPSGVRFLRAYPADDSQTNLDPAVAASNSSFANILTTIVKGKHHGRSSNLP